MTHDIDELKLTAFALGELDGPEFAGDRAELEAHLSADDVAKRHVEEVRATARLVSDGLSAEALPGLSDLQHAAIERRLERANRAGVGSDAAGPFPLGPVRRNWALWGSLAASVLIVCTVMAGVLPMIYHPAGSGGGGTDSANPNPDEGNPAPGVGPIVADPGPPEPASRDAVAGDSRPSSPDIAAFPVAAPPLVNGERGFVRVSDCPLSAVPITSAWPDDADKGSFAVVRRSLAGNRLPPAEGIRTDEILNALPYHYALPEKGQPVGASIEVAGCPWSPGHRLMRVGLRTADSAVPPSPSTRSAFAGSAAKDAGSRVLTALSVQIEFNPTASGAYRLIGYENASLAGAVRYEADDSHAAARAERGLAGALAAARMITALFEVVPASETLDAAVSSPAVPLKYQRLTPLAGAGGNAGAGREMVTVSVRYREAGAPGEADPGPHVLEIPVTDGGLAFAEASEDFRAAAAAASFGMLLRNSPYKGAATYDQVIEAVGPAAAREPSGETGAMLEMVKKAKRLEAKQGS